MKRRKFSPKFKTKVVLEALSERYTLAELAERHKLHPNQISKWKNEFISKAEQVFENGIKTVKSEQEQEKERLLKVIDQKRSR